MTVLQLKTTLLHTSQRIKSKFLLLASQCNPPTFPPLPAFPYTDQYPKMAPSLSSKSSLCVFPRSATASTSNITVFSIKSYRL